VHELSIACAILDASRAAVTERGAGSIEAVRVAVGELTAVDPGLLAHAWEAVTGGGTRLDVEWRPARQHCVACGEDKARTEGTWLRCCPDCGLPVRVEGGRELDLLEIICAEATSARKGAS